MNIFKLRWIYHDTLLVDSPFTLVSSVSFLNIPGSKPTGPLVPIMPGRDAELSL